MQTSSGASLWQKQQKQDVWALKFCLCKLLLGQQEAGKAGDDISVLAEVKRWDPVGELLLKNRSMCSSFLYRAPWNRGLWSPLLALEVLSPTQCLVPTRHELFATSSPIGLVTLAPIPSWQKCLHCLATCFYHLAFKCGLKLSSVTSRATETL